jgi:hypothetical protein
MCGVNPAGFFCQELVMLLSDDPLENARLMREQADETDDPRVATFLRELADDYEAMARTDRAKSSS